MYQLNSIYTKNDQPTMELNIGHLEEASDSGIKVANVMVMFLVAKKVVKFVL